MIAVPAVGRRLLAAMVAVKGPGPGPGSGVGSGPGPGVGLLPLLKIL